MGSKKKRKAKKGAKREAKEMAKREAKKEPHEMAEGKNEVNVGFKPAQDNNIKNQKSLEITDSNKPTNDMAYVSYTAITVIAVLSGGYGIITKDYLGTAVYFGVLLTGYSSFKKFKRHVARCTKCGSTNTKGQLTTTTTRVCVACSNKY